MSSLAEARRARKAPKWTQKTRKTTTHESDIGWPRRDPQSTPNDTNPTRTPHEPHDEA